MSISLNEFSPTTHRLCLVGGPIKRVIVERKGFFNNRLCRWIRHLLGNHTYDLAEIAKILSTTPSESNEHIYNGLKDRVQQKNFTPIQTMLFLEKILCIAPSVKNLPSMPLKPVSGAIRCDAGSQKRKDFETVMKYLTILPTHNTITFSHQNSYDVTYSEGSFTVSPFISSRKGNASDYVRWRITLYRDTNTIDIRAEDAHGNKKRVLASKVQKDLDDLFLAFKNRMFHFPEEESGSIAQPRPFTFF